MKLSTHVKFVVSMILIAAVADFFRSPAIVSWLAVHPVYESLTGAVATGWAAYVTYSQPSASVPLSQNTYIPQSK